MNIWLVKKYWQFNQKQIIELAKFTYSPLEKVFQKKTKKTNEDQGEKQIKAIQNQGKIKTVKKYADNDKDIPLISKKEIFNQLVDERLHEISKLN